MTEENPSPGTSSPSLSKAAALMAVTFSLRRLPVTVVQSLSVSEEASSLEPTLMTHGLSGYLDVGAVLSRGNLLLSRLLFLYV